ncbi:tRNA lysidine(34) synthetase TilS [Piscinibacter terrae]|uniref:tRNA(Ile)-lysidine synthase n=1 Tax=Piscinibacter terrae TaxID=2496871 RepID=A0A3N7HJC5_9BURK|nr:tRNA lysidine(34) synthetase TilS [Albitalea terrae]RQP22154.1 tRNA lysidine(34) synthetase TilS [Albitalea terrae]
MKPRVAVAYSGGRDSTALLHATLMASAEQGVEVVALHVHHGLSAHADAWLAHCQAQCAKWARRGLPIAFAAERLMYKPGKGESIEAWARQARYRALRGMALAHEASLVLLAHHRRDQAETFVLQALRGAGMAGLSGMPREVERDGITWVRPWLDVSREEVQAYVKRHRLKHIDDDSNTDTRFARNRLRHEVWPALVGAFPQAEASLSSAADWAQEAQVCLAELAAMDLQAVRAGKGLSVLSLLALSDARRSNVLRAWLKAVTGRVASAALVSRLIDELPAGASASWPIDDGTLRKYRGVLSHATASPVKASPGQREQKLSIKRAGVHKLPGWHGHLVVERVREGGVPLAWLAHAELREREGGEQFQAGFNRPPRSLKKQFQAAGVPQWERAGPLVYSGGQLVFVPGLGLDARVIGLPGQPQVTLRWEAGYTPA